MTRSLFSGPLLILLWQVVPVHATPDSSGRIRVSVGYGAGSYSSHARVMSCAGETLQSSTERGSWTAPTGGVEAWVSPRVRAAVTATGASATPRGPARWMAGSVVALETASVGLGAGVAHVHGVRDHTDPLFYLRLGTLDRRHARIDLILPDPPANADPWVRVSVGFNQGRQEERGSRWLFGVASRGFRQRAGLQWSGEVLLPLRRDLELALGGQMGMGSIYHESIGVDGGFTSWRLTAGLRASFLR